MPVRIREATASDNEALLALTRSAPMRGTISIRTDRDPDFFSLLRLRGEATVLVAESGGALTGCISLTRRSSFIDGEPRATAYLGDMKVHPLHLGGRTAIRLMHALWEVARSRKEDLHFCVVADGNVRAEALLQGRSGLPAFVSAGSFLVYQLLALRGGRLSGRYFVRSPEGSVERQEARDLDLAWQRRRQFGDPVHDLSAFIAATDPPPVVLVAVQDGVVRATAQLVDASRLKRNVLIDLSPALRIATGILRKGAAVLPLPKPPRLGEAVPMLYLRRLAYGRGHETAARDLVIHARRECARRGVAFLSIAFHELEPHAAVIEGMPRFRFRSNAYIASLGGDAALLDHVRNGIPHEDYTLV